jgi:hypothetical protein
MEIERMTPTARTPLDVRRFGVAMIALALVVIGNCEIAAQSDRGLFVEKLYPELMAAQCQVCHNDNGVASGYGIEFPPKHASDDQILAFGYSLVDYIDFKEPRQSKILLKSSNREEHTGGARLPQGTKGELLLQQWTQRLASMSEQEWRSARELIQQASQWTLEPLSLRRLTHSQYNHTLRDLVGDQSQPANNFPKEDFIRGFKNQIDGQGISPILAEAYSASAERVAKSTFRGGDTRKLLPVEPLHAIDRDAARSFVQHFGKRAFRRWLTANEIEKYQTLFLEQAKQRQDFNAGASAVVEAMLQSPHFLLQVNASHSSADRSFANASRLSYLLWDTMPSEALLEMADQGLVADAEQVELRAREMLDDPKAITALDEFLDQWLRLDNVMSATRDRRRYREFNSEIAAAMVDETRQLFRHLVWNDLSFMEFFTADYTFVSGSLAQFYGFPMPAEEIGRVNYPADSGRAGVLGHGSFFVSTSKPSETSPTARGLFVRNQFLAQEIAPPPPGVNSVLPEVVEDKPMTNRQRLELHLNSEACAGCHRLIDPIGLGLEHFDAIGRYQEKMQLRFGGRDNAVTKELQLDCTAQVQGIANSQFSSPRELGRLLAKQEVCQRCVVKQYFRYAFGREETAADQALIDTAYTKFKDSNFRFREIILTMVTSPQFLGNGK